MKRENKKIKKKVWISCAIVLITLMAGVGSILIINFQHEKLKQEIKSHYNKEVIVVKNTKLYDKNEKEVGSVKKGYPLTLKEVKINNHKQQYFQIKDTNYYLYYQDVKKQKQKEEQEKNDHYLVFNQNIRTKKKTTFYQQGKEVLRINDSINLPIEYMDNEYYYVTYLNSLLQIKKQKENKIVDHQNTTEKESDYISVLHYEKIENQCNDNICVPISKVKEQLNYLKENGYYAITTEEYKSYLEGNLRLKEKAVLLTCSNENDTLKQIEQEYSLKIPVLNDQMGLKFNNTNKKSTKESKLDSIDRYQIKNNTSIDDFKKMTLGEEVKEVVIIPKKSSSREQAIPVLNYHFFYDPNAGESCNEGICLDVATFRKQLDYLKSNGYKTLKMEEFKKWMYKEIELPQKSVLITVDDGAMGTGRHNGNKLIPILEEYNMNATLFLITGWWGVDNYRSPNLDIQSHTNDMHQYGSCGKGQVVCATREQLLEDLQRSLSIVDNNNSFCFPFYSYSDLSLKTVEEAGFKMAFIGGNRKAKRSDNKFKIPRYPIHKTTSMQSFINMVN